ncbi:uroporphyrinogen-III synthase [Microbacterium sp. SLBN-146]|uniref:uroporphyrinogen-III synthase n=1 Tax=Microbacterium sp. SLBN-146 TaxID=2768457 RepID=UPI001153FB98|nr:uroporphyrinogen-III synthase [Microbacterium sp. SLBN-146]TQJ30933.1 uroporphyrinogen-III synthase [Microbacterium sp. SLBN-146]
MTDPTRPALSAALAGTSIVIAVDRRSSELAAALERHGALVRHAPALTIVPHIDDEALISATRALIQTRPDVVVATTGVGFRGWMETAEEAGMLDELYAALAGAQIVARGPKARGAIQQAGLSADWVAESETSAELGEFLLAEGLAGRRVAVQHHGSGADGLDDLFAAAGADVVSLTVYRWGPPPDPALVSRSVIATAHGEVDAVLFTSAPGAAGWLAAAEECGVRERIVELSSMRRLLLAAVGPITAAPLAEVGAKVLVAERGRLGSLVRGVVTHFGGGHAPSLQTGSGRLELRSTGALLNGSIVPLSPSGNAVLRALFDAAGGVVSRPELQSVLPRSIENAHAVDVAVGRLREALGDPRLIRTVVKRGYRLDVVESGLDATEQES